MPNRKLAYQVDVDTSSGVRDLRRLGTEGARAGRELADGFDDAATNGQRALSTLSAGLDRLEADVTGTARAVAAIGSKLGEGFDSSRVEGFVGDLQRLGVSFDEVEAKAEEFADVIRRTDSIKLDAANKGLTSVGSNLDRVTSSGDQSRSVLANLAGNAAQDLGQLGGVVGSLGVGLGQLAEYSVDGTIKLANLAKVAGPMVALSAGLFLVEKVMSNIAANEAFDTAQAERFRDVVDQAGDAGRNLRDALRETGEFFDTRTEQGGLAGWLQLDETNNLLDEYLSRLNAAGIGVDDLVNFMENAGPDASRAFKDQLAGTNLTLEEQEDIYDQVILIVSRYREEVGNARREAQFFAETTDSANEALAGMADPLQTLPDLWARLIDDAKDGAFQLADAGAMINQLAEATGLSTTEVIERIKQGADEATQANLDNIASWEQMKAAIDDVGDAFDLTASRAEAIGAALDDANGSASELTAAQETIAFADALTNLRDRLIELRDADVGAVDLVPDTWDEVLAMPAELGPVVDALATFRDQVSSELGQAFTTGGATGARAWAEDTRTAITESLAEAGVESEAAVNQVLEALGLLPPQVDTVIQVSHAEQARTLIGNLESAIAGLPVDTQLTIQTLASTDPVAALRAAIDAFTATGANVPVELVALTEQFETDAGVAVDEVAGSDPTVTVGARAAPSVGQTKATVDKAAEDRETTINANLTQQIVQGLLLAAFLDHAARPRRADINVFLNGWALAQVLLDNVARARTAPVMVDLPNLGSAEYLLDRLTRTRFARVVTTGGGGGGGGGGDVAGFASFAAAGDEADGAGEAAGFAAFAPMAAADPLVDELAGVSASSSSSPTTVVVDRRPVQVNVQAAVIGSRYDVQRAVRGALADAERLGRRP